MSNNQQRKIYGVCFVRGVLDGWGNWRWGLLLLCCVGLSFWSLRGLRTYCLWIIDYSWLWWAMFFSCSWCLGGCSYFACCTCSSYSVYLRIMSISCWFYASSLKIWSGLMVISQYLCSWIAIPWISLTWSDTIPQVSLANSNQQPKNLVPSTLSHSLTLLSPYYLVSTETWCPILWVIYKARPNSHSTPLWTKLHVFSVIVWVLRGHTQTPHRIYFPLFQ